MTGINLVIRAWKFSYLDYLKWQSRQQLLKGHKLISQTKYIARLLAYLSITSVLRINKKLNHIVYNMYSKEYHFFRSSWWVGPFALARRAFECFCLEHVVPLELRATLCTLKLLRLLVDMLGHKAVLVANEKILSQFALVWNKTRMNIIVEPRI